MAKPRSLGRRPATPNLKLQNELRIKQQQQQQQQQQHTATNPASPPETPTTSPPLSRKISQKPRHQPPFDYIQSLADDAIQPVGHGHQFSYRPVLGPEQLSPRLSESSSSSSESASDVVDDSADDELSERGSVGSLLPDASDPETSDDDDEDDEDEDEDEDEDDSDDAQDRLSDVPVDVESEPEEVQTVHLSATVVTTLKHDFTIEDIDPMDSGCEGLDVLFPTEIESNRSRSRSRHKDLDNGMLKDLQNLSCRAFIDDPYRRPLDRDAEEYDEEEAFLRRRAELKRIRRVSMSSSFGKRTHSELSDSDGDDAGTLDVNDVGSSARRMRKRLHRGSLLFQDPPAPRIDELEEPDSSEDDFGAEQSLAMELPYWAGEIFEAGPP